MAILSCHVSIKLPPKISDGQDFSAGVAWFGDILNIEDRSSRLDPVRSLTIGGRYQAVASGGESAHDLTPLVPAWSVGRENGGVASG